MSSSLSHEGIEALAILATEWFKAARRMTRVTRGFAPTQFERERAQLVYSERRVEDALSACGMRLITYDGSDFSAHLPAEPVNPEDFESEEDLTVIETLEPTVLHDGRIVLRGRVVLARSP
jgi:hypothetical protein